MSNVLLAQKEPIFMKEPVDHHVHLELMQILMPELVTHVMTLVKNVLHHPVIVVPNVMSPMDSISWPTEHV